MRKKYQKLIGKIYIKLLIVKLYYFKLLCLFGRHKRVFFVGSAKRPLNGRKAILNRDYVIVDLYRCSICEQEITYNREYIPKSKRK